MLIMIVIVGWKKKSNIINDGELNKIIFCFNVKSMVKKKNVVFF